MIRRLFLALLLLAAMGGVCPAHALTPAQRVILLSQPGPSLDLNFTQMSSLPGMVSFSRSSGATSALYTDAAGASFAIYTADQPRLSSDGLLIEERRTNYLLNSGSPATQTVTLAVGTYILFGNGTGSLTSAAGTAIGTGFGTLSPLSGNFQTITITTAGTVTITVSGAVNWFDLQDSQGQSSLPTSHIVTAGAAETRSSDVAHVPTSAFTYNPTAGTFFASGRQPTAASFTRYIGDSGSPVTPLFVSGSQTISSFNGLTQIDGPAINSTTLAKVAQSYDPSGQSLTANGQVAAVFSTPFVAISGIGIGASQNGGINSSFNGWIGRVRYWPRRLSNSQLQQLTQ